MTTAFSDEQLVHAAADVVWAALTDWGRAGEWMPGVTGMTAGGPPAEGTDLTFSSRGKERHSRIARFDEGRALTLTSAVTGVSAAYHYALRPAEDGDTWVSLVAEVETSGPMRLLGGVVRSAIAKEDGVQLTRLKALVEGR